MSSDTILLSHGSGGKKSQELLKFIYEILGDVVINHGEDSGVISIDMSCYAMTTDSYTIDPIFFPGGNIGKLAVCGTLNDLAMVGAVPEFITLSLMIEEGFSFADLESIVRSISSELKKTSVKIIAGDTKIISRGKIDKIFINTAGFGKVIATNAISSINAQPGDSVIVTGSVGDHGSSIMAYRNGFSEGLRSDCANVAPLIQVLIEAGIDVHTLRDPTRGGLASIMNEIAESSGVSIELYEEKIPIRDSVNGVCDALGIDPLYMACEGRAAIFVPEDQAKKVIEILSDNELAKDVAIVGFVKEKSEKPKVYLRTYIGARRILPLLSREQTPRIC
ncbi:MAG TPA: hydrogenase expression/formation protein HypE [Candidatus Cloacimonetes bacterium]|nr:hydrogenase expression/formation protein HypE [Candidatus Cloacimonadota bacterium]HEX38093.1 hydrogenase expression/formation protein HypE [Candidatus Cloacimonadota bacterium]